MAGVQSKAERIAMIREAAKKFQHPVVTSRQTAPKRDQEDERHYTDAPRYAAEYYGEVFYETTRFDKDWD